MNPADLILNQALEAATDLGLEISDPGNGMFFFVSPLTENRYRVRALDDETSIEVEECDAHGYGLGQNYMQIRNPAGGFLRAVLANI